MAQFPLISMNSPFSPIWSGLADSSLRPTLMVVRDGSGYHPLDASSFNIAFSGGVSVTGVVAVDAVGITGKNNVVLDVISYSGLGIIPVAIVSGSAGGGSSSSSSQVGLSGTNGTFVNVITVSGFNALPVFNPSGVKIEGILSTTSRPTLPALRGTYAINLTGTGSFSNYTGVIFQATNATISVEPASDNNGIVWYAFSGTASTGYAWELRGDRTFEVSNTTELYFAQNMSGNRVMVHYQTYTP